MPGQVPKWVWEKTDPSVSGSSGDLAKLFRNEDVKNPGIFAKNTPSNAATLMAREVIQNSSDAAEELRIDLGDDAPEFEIDFLFEELSADAKFRLIENLDLGSLEARVHGEEDDLRSRLGLFRDDCLEGLHDASIPLKTLKIVERGTTGMYGPFEGAKSKMYLALISLGYTMKLDGSGGSYGYGKAGLIRGSRTRTVVAYTCFKETPNEPNVTRRLLGMTYWGQHDVESCSYTGFARYGDEDAEGKVRPLVNDDADQVAKRLGLDIRDPSNDDDLGTTFLLLDPIMRPEELVKAIERNWWPAIIDGILTATVIATSGTELIPRPKSDEVLASFIQAYELALVEPDNRVQGRRRTRLSNYELADGTSYRLGHLGMVADLEGWSYTVDDSESEDINRIQHKSLVALMRQPRMVVEYLPAGSAKPHIRGVFVADEQVNELLRQSEPKAHDAWQTRIDEESVDPKSPLVAKAINDRIKNNISGFRHGLKPPPRPAEDIRLPELEKLFKNLFQSQGPENPPPPPGERPFSIKVDRRLVAVSDAELTIRGVGALKFSLRDDPDLPDVVESEICVSYRFLEDGGTGEESLLEIQAPSGFTLIRSQPYIFRGEIGHGQIEFTFQSDAYPSDWTARLRAEAQIVGADQNSVGEGDQ